GGPAELVLAVRPDPLGEILALGDPLGRTGQTANRRQRSLRYGKAEAAGDRHPARGDQDEEDPDPIERVVDLAQGPCHLQRVRVAPVVLDRGCVDAILSSGDGGVVEPALPEARTASALRDLEGG